MELKQINISKFSLCMKKNKCIDLKWFIWLSVDYILGKCKNRNQQYVRFLTLNFTPKINMNIKVNPKSNHLWNFLVYHQQQWSEEGWQVRLFLKGHQQLQAVRSPHQILNLLWKHLNQCMVFHLLQLSLRGH